MTSRCTTIAALAALIALSACDNTKPPTPSVLSTAEAASKDAVPLGSGAASDPSLPSASVVQTEPAAPTSRDDASTRPRGNLSPTEESNAMPKAGQANNHSSPSLESPKPAASK
jgi:hypothetical protein